MHVPLADVFMHAVVGDKARGRCSIALRVNERIDVAHARQQRCPALHLVFFREAEIGHCGTVFGIVFLSSFQRVLQS